MSAGYEYDYQLEKERKREIYLDRIRDRTREFIERYSAILNDIANQDLDTYVKDEYYKYTQELTQANNLLYSDPESARNISQSIGKLIGALPKKAKARRKIYQEQENKRYKENREIERKRQQKIREIERYNKNITNLKNIIQKFCDKYENRLKKIKENNLEQYITKDYKQAFQELQLIKKQINTNPEVAKESSVNLGKWIDALFKKAQSIKAQEKKITEERKKSEQRKQEYLNKQKLQEQKKEKIIQENLDKLRDFIQKFYDKYEKILLNIKNNNLEQYIKVEYNQALEELENIKRQIRHNPQNAKELSISLGGWINTLYEQAKTSQSIALKKKKEKEEAEKQRLIRIKKEKQEEEYRLQQEFQYILDSALQELVDPVLRDFAIDDIEELISLYKNKKINATNIENIKTDFNKKYHSIINIAKTKTEEFEKEFFQQVDEEADKEAVLDLIKSEKNNLLKIKTDDPSKLTNIMNKLIQKEEEIKNNKVKNIDLELNAISNSIINEEVTEEYRRHTIKSIIKILKNLGFSTSKPKLENNEVRILAKKINGEEFEAIVRLDGSMMSHFNGYDYMACKDDINNLEQELQSCYGIELEKTKTIWENPDRIQKNAKPLSDLIKGT